MGESVGEPMKGECGCEVGIVYCLWRREDVKEPRCVWGLLGGGVWWSEEWWKGEKGEEKVKRIKAEKRERRRRKLRERVDGERGGESGKESLEGEGVCEGD